MPASVETVEKGAHFIQMNGREVFRFASRAMAHATRDAIAAAQLKLDDISLLVPHQANIRIIESALKDLQFPKERCIINVEHYGNTSTASIPIAVCEALQEGRIHPEDKIVLVGFGAGLTWGAIVAQWSGPFPTKRKVYPLVYRLLARVRSALLRLARHIDGLIWGRRNPEI
jgi:3-oxoacyl-[acyl-carrier-protein] synthase-3